MAPTTDPLDAWLHRGDRAMARRPALATRTPEGWTELSYADLDRRSHQVAGWLATRGVGAGDRVAIAGEAGADWVVALFGVWRRGAVAVPLDARFSAEELGPIVGRARPSAVIASASVGERVGFTGAPLLGFEHLEAHGDGDDAARAADDIARAADDIALVVWTSGSTGAPKGVTLSFANIAYVVDQGRAAHDLDGDDRWLSILPLDHMLEVSCGLLPALASGACFAFAGTAAPQAVAEAMVERGVTRMTVVPLFLAALLAHIDGADRSGRLPGATRLTLHCGGAPLDPAIARRFEGVGIAVYTGYGLTEVAPVVTMNTPTACRHGSVGGALPGTEVRIGVRGEILVRSPGVMTGYWDDPALTATAVDEAGWFHTGDLGQLDSDGFLYVTGRTKTLIVLASGRKVQPEEVEEALAASTVLAEVCVVGRQRGDGSEEVCAVVVATPDLRARCSSPGELAAAATDEVARLTAGLARFKRPVAVRVVDGNLPRTAKHSVRRAEVARLIADA